ncbi:MAG TPA: hypothetical protein VFF73_25910, partial [Planctomycetota bacterium]|nr:hypothetical protein [Planctomycetota bacterium]
MEQGRIAFLVVFVLLGGCGGEEQKPPPPPPRVEVLDPAVSQKIDDALYALNNSNREERYRNNLIECGQSGEMAKRAVIDRTVAEVKRSYAAPPGGQRLLNSGGRRRAIEALDKVAGNDPQALEIFKMGAKETNAEVASAAGAALAARGDDSAFATLLVAIKLAKGDREVQGRAAAGLVKLAKPERKDEVLASVEATSRDALAPVVSACLPADDTERAKALAAIVRENANPQARIVAIEELRKAKDPELVDFARTQATADDADLRAYSLKLIATQEPRLAATTLKAVLEQDPKDPAEVAKALATVDARETIEGACALVTDASRAGPTRAACARHVLSRVKDDKAPASLHDAAAQERALGVLRRSIRDRNDEIAKASIEALGRVGDASDAETL